MKKDSYLLGILLVLIGVLFLLLNFNIISFKLLLFLLSIGLIIGYFSKHQLGYLISGSVLLVISSVYLLDEAILPSINIKSFLFLSIFGIISLILYYKQNNEIFLILGGILPSLGLYNLINKISVNNVFWVFLLLTGFAFFIIYLIGYRRSGIEWPKHLSVIILILSILFWFLSKIRGQFKFRKFIIYLWPLLLIVIGGKIIYNIIKSKR